MLKPKVTKQMTVGEIAKLIHSGKLVVGDEVLDVLSCEYSECANRNRRKGKRFCYGIANSAAAFSTIGGSMIFYEMKDGKTIAVEGRGRCWGIERITVDRAVIDLTQLDQGVVPWPQRANIDGCMKCTINEYPDWAVNNILSTPIQVTWLSHKDTSWNEARELFCVTNSGVQKVSRNETYDVLYHGDMTKLVTELASDTQLWEAEVITDAHRLSKADKTFVGFLIQQTQDGRLGGRSDLQSLYSQHIVLNGYRDTAIEHFNKAKGLVFEVMGSNMDHSIARSHGFFLVLSFVLCELERNGVDVLKCATKIRKTVSSFIDDMVAFKSTREGNRTGLSKQKIDLQYRWKSNGHDVDGRGLKLRRARLLRDEVILQGGGLPKKEAEKVPAMVKW